MTADATSILDRLKRLHPRVIDLSLDRIFRLLDRLGNPHERLPPVVHVAGTNGKGSTIAFLRSMLAAHGRTTHVYTSPHLVRFNERIVIAGREIDDLQLTELLDRCERANDGEPITFFEITTAAAFLAFAEAPADYTLLETGLGGRLDATNVVACPAVTIITPVSIDHRSFLGDTVEAIASEKAGILKPGVAAAVARQEPAALHAITQRADAVGADLVREGRDWTIAADAGGMRWTSGDRSWALPSPVLPGPHQLQNAGTSIAALAMIPEIMLDPGRVAIGLGSVHWPARLQRLGGNRSLATAGRLARLLPDGWELWLDGGHNPGAAAVLAAQLERWRDRPRYAVIGMLQAKDADGFIAPLAGCLDAVVTVAIPDEPASFDAGSLATLIGRHHIEAATAERVEAALDGLGRRPGPARVLICGSLYLAGHVLAADATG